MDEFSGLDVSLPAESATRAAEIMTNVAEQANPEPDEPVLTEAEEQAIRDHFRYSPTEKRTQAERRATAARILEKVRRGEV